jgi:hypothetical protein
MRLPSSAVLAALGIVAAIPLALAAQTIKKCDLPKTPVGDLRASSATLSYRVTKDAKLDTASLGVVSTDGISAAEARSVAIRILGACRFDVPKGSSPDQRVITPMKFDSGVAIGATTHADPAAPLLPLDALDLASDAVPLLSTDSRVEERPRITRCPSLPPPTIGTVSGRGASRQEAAAQANAELARQFDIWNHTNSGELVADVVIRTDGKVDANVKVVTSSNPGATATLANRIQDCTWVPGRAHGIVIPVRYRARMYVSPLTGQ